MSLGGVVILAVLAWPGSASQPRAAFATSSVSAVTHGVRFARGLTLVHTESLTDDGISNPRLDARIGSHDPAQFVGVRALRFDPGRYRPSKIDAKLELRMTGDSASLGLGGAVSRLLRQVAR